MDLLKSSKINQLISRIPEGAVLTSSWLSSQGYPPDLVRVYRKRRWLEPIGRGAWARAGQSVSWRGAIYAVQKQLDLEIHPAAVSALGLHGKAHYIPLGKERLFLFGANGAKLPKWFRDYNWGVATEYRTTNTFSDDQTLGLKAMDIDGLSLMVSSPERAMLELLLLVPDDLSFDFAREHMEVLTSLRSKLVQRLLEVCHSIKAKRLFLFLAEEAGMKWFRKLDLEKIDLGVGKRTIAKNGKYNSKYQITVPKD